MMSAEVLCLDKPTCYSANVVNPSRKGLLIGCTDNAGPHDGDGKALTIRLYHLLRQTLRHRVRVWMLSSQTLLQNPHGLVVQVFRHVNHRLGLNLRAENMTKTEKVIFN